MKAWLFIQWKGTDLCADFRCECGHDPHLEGYFFYAVRCSECGRVYRLPNYFQEWEPVIDPSDLDVPIQDV